MVQKWDYYVCSCYCKFEKEPNINDFITHRLAKQPEPELEGNWILILDKDFNLSDGLVHMGNLGYELVGIQASNLKTGGDITSWYQPDYLYVFKRPRN